MEMEAPSDRLLDKSILTCHKCPICELKETSGNCESFKFPNALLKRHSDGKQRGETGDMGGTEEVKPNRVMAIVAGDR